MILPSVLSEASSLEAKKGGEQRDTREVAGFPGRHTEGNEEGIQMEEVEREDKRGTQGALGT